MKIYLAGSVPKGDKESKEFINWRLHYASVISKHSKDAELTDPNAPTIEGDSLGVTGTDCFFIKQSDLVVVYAEKKLGAGTAMELVVAKYLNKPVITVLPKDTHHRRTNLLFEGRNVADWIHPFIDTFSDFVIEDISQFKDIYKKLKSTKIKSISIIDEAIQYAQKFIE